MGTNGEIVLAPNGDVLTCSTAAGPAFEGGSIRQGMRGEPGAICRVAMDEDVHVETVAGTEPRGICGSGLIDAVSEMVRLGIIDRYGRIHDPKDLPLLPPKVKGRVRPGKVGYAFLLHDGDRQVRLIQKDISELQLAKGALRAGIAILLEEKGIPPSELDEILLAGAFGSNIRAESLKGIGLLPDIPLERITSVGNAAGKGAVIGLLARGQLGRATSIAARCRHMELSLNKRFAGRFAESLRFPPMS